MAMQFSKALVMLAVLACSSAAAAAAAERSLLQSTGMDDLSAVSIPQATLAASALRIATVQATPAGPVFTMAGQLDSASQLLQAMAASQDLVAAMTPEAVTQLNSLAADATKIDANPGTTTLLAGLENPINGAELLTQMAQLNTEAPAGAVSAPSARAVSAPAAGAATTAAAASAAPAPANGAGAQGVAVMATAGAALLAALLL